MTGKEPSREWQLIFARPMNTTEHVSYKLLAHSYMYTCDNRPIGIHSRISIGIRFDKSTGIKSLHWVNFLRNAVVTACGNLLLHGSVYSERPVNLGLSFELHHFHFYLRILHVYLEIGHLYFRNLVYITKYGSYISYTNSYATSAWLWLAGGCWKCSCIKFCLFHFCYPEFGASSLFYKLN